MDQRILFLLMIGCCLDAAYGGPVYTDCERPPTILHGKTELSVDDAGIVVTATYSCDPGYQLDGSSQLVCDTDTDIWQNDLPACKLVTGGDSKVSEIEPIVLIIPFATVSPDISHQEIKSSAEAVDRVAVLTDATEVPSDNNINTSVPSIHQEPEANEVPKIQTNNFEAPQKKPDGGREHDIEEDNNIDDEFASRLDMSCAGILAPPISNAHIARYDRRKHGEFGFIVAVYECEENFDLENPIENLKYCSNKNWIGDPPVCVQKSRSDADDSDEGATKSLDGPNIAVDETDQNNGDITNNGIDPQIVTDRSANSGHEDDFPNWATCEENNGGCDQICNMVHDVDIADALIAECSCNLGYYLETEGGKHCLDINECANLEVEESCPNGCENTVGSYRCTQSSSETGDDRTSNKNISVIFGPNSPVKTCGDAFRLDASNNCIDIDECAEGNTGCENCQNLFGDFECVCREGFELNSDGKTCRDIDECKIVLDDEYNVPTEETMCSYGCINTVGSFICICPLNFHLGDDKRTCEPDLCRHLSDIASNKTKCSHDCVDGVDGYLCKCPEGMDLDVDLKNCIVIDACQSSGDRCSPGKCVNLEPGSFRCDCPVGYAEHNQRCIDYDECAADTHQCSHECKNTAGSYVCLCPNDLILATDQHTCISTDLCQNDNGGCSNMCNVVNEQVTCSCPDGFELESDAQTCRLINICAKNNGECQHVCNDKLNRCECHPGYETFDNGKTCHDLNECLNNPCAQQCLNTDGSFECKCFDGYEKDASTGQCRDVDECSSSNNQCEHGCTNTEGSFVCTCRDGYQLAKNRLNCVDINECEFDNGRCSHFCENLPGDHKCTCPEGYRMDREKQSCVQIRDTCPALVPPINGEVSCSRSLLRSQTFYGTKCNVWCHEGFTLVGPKIRSCNGSTGLWDSAKNTCVRSTCPAFHPPSHGSFNSTNCYNGNTYPGQSCTLTCAQGFESVGNGVITCLPGRVWSTSVLNCVAVKAERKIPKKRINQGGFYTSGHINVEEPVPSVQIYNQHILQPYIKCPRNAIILIQDNRQQKAHIKLEQPKSNVDWTSHIDAEPPWAKKLELYLGVGVHTFKFRAHSPNSVAIRDECQTVITVKKAADASATQNNRANSFRPKVLFCPQNIQIQLQANELQRSVSWKEPVFSSIHNLKPIFKSSIPGRKFGPGHHRITYIATDVRNQNGTCQFFVIVRAPAAAYKKENLHPRVQFQNRLSDHDSYLICPNKPDLKIDTSFPIQIPSGCIIKNVRINHYNPHRRRHALAPSNNFLKHYSSWNRHMIG